MDNTDSDIEDLEVMLYSQVFHGNNDDEMANNTFQSPNNSHRLSNRSEKSRYYSNNSMNSANFLQYHQNLSDYIDQHCATTSNNSIPCQHVDVQNVGFSPMLRTPIYMQPQVNNIVVIPPAPTQIITSDGKNNKYYKKLLKWQHEMKHKKFKCAERKKQRRKEFQKRKQMERTKNQNNSANQTCLSDKSTDVQIIESSVEVICLSDDDNPEEGSSIANTEICDKILSIISYDKMNKQNVTSDKSKDENAKDNSILSVSNTGIDMDEDDDVIYIPPDPKANAIINLDPDDSYVDSIEDKDNSEKQPSNVKDVITPSERKEMLSTPESTASNDFLDTTAVGVQQKFNFSLHGSDFVPTTTTEFLRPKTPADNNDIYETESSCSATDFCSTPLKNPVLQEIDFESNNDLFKDNLENFGNYIVPKRDLTPNISEKSTPVTPLNESASKNSLLVHSESDSSSESEYDSEVTMRKCKLSDLRKTDDLPNLSPIQIIDDDSDDGIEKHSKKSKQKKKKSKLKPDAVVSGDKRRNIESCENPSKKIKSEETESKKPSPDVIAVDCNSNSSTASSVFMLSDLNNLKTDLNLANCSSTDLTNKNQNGYKPRKLSDYWKADIKEFYEQDWDLEQFTLENVMANMSNDPNKWKISEADRYYLTMQTSNRKRCYICRESDHKATKCPKKDMPVKCSLCGEKNHMEPRCPNKICTMCGQHSNFSTISCKNCIHERKMRCKICNLVGHIMARCPDLWRRYHSTITETAPLKPSGPSALPQDKRWCSGCGSQGHYEFNCKYHRMHPPVDPHVKSYNDVYNYKRFRTEQRKRKDIDDASSTDTNVKIVEASTSEAATTVDDNGKTENKTNNESNSESIDQILSTSANNIVIKVNSGNTNDNNFTNNREFSFEPSVSHHSPDINIQNPICSEAPTVSQLPGASCLPLVNPSSLSSAESSKQEMTLTIDYWAAKYFINNTLGKAFIYLLESELKVNIKITLDNGKNGSVVITGKKYVVFVRDTIRKYMKHNMQIFNCLNCAKAIAQFLRIVFMPTTKTLVNNYYSKVKTSKKCFRQATAPIEKIEAYLKILKGSFVLNQAYSKIGRGEINTHVQTLCSIRKRCCAKKFELTQMNIEQLINSFYYVYYSCRSLTTYDILKKK